MVINHALFRLSMLLRPPDPDLHIPRGCLADLGMACLSLSRLIYSHIILFILSTEYYSFYQLNGKSLLTQSAGTIAPIRASATLPDKEPSTTPLSIPATAGGGGAKSDS